MIELLIMDDLMIVLSPIETFGPIIESLISQSPAILTGSMIIVFLKSYFFLASFERFNNTALVSSRFVLLPQSYQFPTWKVATFEPFSIIFMMASVRLYSSRIFCLLDIMLSRISISRDDSLIR